MKIEHKSADDKVTGVDELIILGNNDLVWEKMREKVE